MLKWCELQKNVTKVMLPNDCIGLVTEISPIQTMKGGLLRGRDKVKCSYTTRKGGWTEAWFQLRQLRKYEIVVKKIVTDVQPVPQGEESWKSEELEPVKVIDQVKTEEVIVPVIGGTIVELDEKIGKLIEDNKEVINKLEDKSEEDKQIDDDNTELGG